MNACSSTRMHGASRRVCSRPEVVGEPTMCVWSAAAVRNSSFLTHVPSQTGQPRGSARCGITHGNHPRSTRLCRIFQCLAVPRQPLKLLETLEILKRLASAVQLRPWPPHFKAVNGIASYPPSPLSVRSFSARFPATMMVKDLNSKCLSLSPLLSTAWLRMAIALPLLQPCDHR